MKNFRFLVLVSLVAVSMTFVGCRHANKLSQFGDDIAKFGDDAAKYGDDVIRAGEKLFDDDEKKVNVSSSYNTYDYDEPAEYNDGDEDSGNVPNMRKDSRDYYYEPQPVLVPCNACGGQGVIVDMYSGCAYDCAFCDNGMVQSYQ